MWSTAWTAAAEAGGWVVRVLELKEPPLKMENMTAKRQRNAHPVEFHAFKYKTCCGRHHCQCSFKVWVSFFSRCCGSASPSHAQQWRKTFAQRVFVLICLPQLVFYASKSLLGVLSAILIGICFFFFFRFIKCEEDFISSRLQFARRFKRCCAAAEAMVFFPPQTNRWDYTRGIRYPSDKRVYTGADCVNPRDRLLRQTVL